MLMAAKKKKKNSENTLHIPFQELNKISEGAYSYDRPNPLLGSFVSIHGTAFDPESDSYDVDKFAKPLHVENRRSPVNDLHIYWSKKPHDAVQEYINHYAPPGSIVLDPFAGSGGTLLCALRNGCSAVGIDLSPAATFISSYYCTPVDLAEFEDCFHSIERDVKDELSWLYESRSPNGDHATVAYTVWSQVFRCARCLAQVPFGLCVEVPLFNKDGSRRKTRTGEPATGPACPFCNKKGQEQLIDTGSPRYGRVPLRSSCQGSKRFERKFGFPSTGVSESLTECLSQLIDSTDNKADRFELSRLLEIQEKKIPHDFPTSRMMNSSEDTEKWGVLWRAGVADFSTVDQLFDKRALWALSAYFNAARKVTCSEGTRRALLGVLSSGLWNCTRMYREREKGGGPQEGVYYLPPLAREVNVGTVVAGKRKTFISANSAVATTIKSSNLCISTQTATDLSAIPSNSVDYIFTDPPYSWKVPYGELNFLWESFLGFETRWHDKEVIVSDVRGIDEHQWSIMLRKAFTECYRVLKPGRCLTLCYHDSAEGTWEFVQDILAEAGFIPEQGEKALSIGTGQKSLKQLTSGKITQRDLVINFRKPPLSEIFGNDGKDAGIDSKNQTFREGTLSIIREFLLNQPGSTKDRIYDEVVTRLIYRRQMEAHNFEELLRLVAEAGADSPDKWFLKESEDLRIDETEAAKEDRAAGALARFTQNYLADNPEQEGIHYSELFEQYICTIKEKPRRQLQDWLPDYFCITQSGTYRLPMDEEEARLKAANRNAGVNRQIKRFLAFIQNGQAVPERLRPNDQTLAEWLRHCKRSGLFEQGRLLYEKGGMDVSSLSEELAINADEDYQVCVRMLTRSAAKVSVSRQKRGGRTHEP